MMVSALRHILPNALYYKKCKVMPCANSEYLYQIVGLHRRYHCGSYRYNINYMTTPSIFSIPRGTACKTMFDLYMFDATVPGSCMFLYVICHLGYCCHMRSSQYLADAFFCCFSQCFYVISHNLESQNAGLAVV